MILKRDKRKRKNSLKESNEVLSDEDKYLAYTKKSANKKKNNKEQPAGTVYATNFESSPDRIKKTTNKVQLECRDNAKIDESVNMDKHSITISAKPKIYKDTVKLNVSSNPDCRISKISKKLNKNEIKSVTKKHSNRHNTSALSGITLITPQVISDPDSLIIG